MSRNLTISQALSLVLGASLQERARHRDALEWTVAALAQRDDALSRANATLFAALAESQSSFMLKELTDLDAAAKAFLANDLPDRAALCDVLRARHLKLRDSTGEALDYAERALATPSLRVEGRFMLLSTIVDSQCDLLRFDEAYRRLQRDFLPVMDAARPSAHLALAYADASYHHFRRALRAGRLRTLYSLDLDDQTDVVTPAARQAMEPELLIGRRYLSRASVIDPDAARPWRLMGDASILALDGKPAAAIHAYGPRPDDPVHALIWARSIGWVYRISGRWQAALDVLQPAAESARRSDLPYFERRILFEVGICARALTDYRLASDAHERLLTLQARIPSNAAASGSTDERSDDAPETRVALRATGSATHPAFRRSLPPYVRRALKLMEETLSDRLPLSEVAQRVDVRPRTLQAGLRSACGTTFLEAYRAAAMSAAMGLLRGTDLSIADVATQVGYVSAASFSRDFRREYGLPPSSVRDERKQRLG